MNEKMIRKYANMLATVGINVQKGQKVLVEACIEGYAFANIFAQECYKEGAEVHIKRVKSHLPPLGQVGILSITDKQFGSMELFTEKKERKAPVEYSQLELF